MEAHGFETKTYDNQVLMTRFTRLGKQTHGTGRGPSINTFTQSKIF
jgi:hypothetical protein